MLATQNPIDFEGTYPLPEAQLDRFLAKLGVGYPTSADERAMLWLGHRGVAPPRLADVTAVAEAELLLAARDEVDAVGVADRGRRLRRRPRPPDPRAAERLAGRLARARRSTCSPRRGRRRASPDGLRDPRRRRSPSRPPCSRHRLVMSARGRARAVHDATTRSTPRCRRCPSRDDADAAGGGPARRPRPARAASSRPRVAVLAAVVVLDGDRRRRRPAYAGRRRSTRRSAG